MLSDRFSAAPQPPHFNLSQFWVIGKNKEDSRRDLCCICGNEIDPLERELDGSIKKSNNGSWVLANMGITAFGARCSNCRNNRKRVFYYGANISNIHVDNAGNIRFAILIDQTWQDAEYLINDAFAATVAKIYRPDLANNPKDARRALILISRDELKALYANANKK